MLGAVQEVEDSLASLRLLEREAETQARAVEAAERSLTLATNRYRGGVVTYLEVIVAQTAALDNERTAVTLQARRLLSSVLLIKALGGGWAAAPCRPSADVASNLGPGVPAVMTPIATRPT